MPHIAENKEMWHKCKTPEEKFEILLGETTSNWLYVLQKALLVHSRCHPQSSSKRPSAKTTRDTIFFRFLVIPDPNGPTKMFEISLFVYWSWVSYIYIYFIFDNKNFFYRRKNEKIGVGGTFFVFVLNKIEQV